MGNNCSISSKYSDKNQVFFLLSKPQNSLLIEDLIKRMELNK